MLSLCCRLVVVVVIPFRYGQTLSWIMACDGNENQLPKRNHKNPYFLFEAEQRKTENEHNKSIYRSLSLFSISTMITCILHACIVFFILFYFFSVDLFCFCFRRCSLFVPFRSRIGFFFFFVFRCCFFFYSLNLVTFYCAVLFVSSERFALYLLGFMTAKRARDWETLLTRCVRNKYL